ncbi:tyrosine-type recombinase/integrase [Actinomadura madurae]|uniref:tyrosine-type recombinase/integrase n=1 Tax=Actinomadura madurae TaxID=1993 RepID=UPI0020D23EB1|nr:tyrosine-type recombinase/integrase [Actinomadura madurae]MCP9947310.1 tyrosine-type recombinase/integrase [Actinomadura madurae]MCP9964072.1 tyrosine-type recombinase/integrase [Actinomadura madurae]MCP9976546.1 tyrosine-type recombinase/integrase [Actinomadura madurae]MCQ0011955.1 tyrosine-type recombinase/integrase [Actinomadura madurae]MCQ0012743.1 tyrosine-type recombinase/integrase [Actinomadura madurae]
MTELEHAAGALVLRPASNRAVAYADVDYSVSAETVARLLEAPSPNTLAAYEHAWGKFAQWCLEQGRVTLPATPQTLADFVVQLIGLSLAPATIDQAIGAIRSRHSRAGYRNEPDTRAALDLLRAYRREWVDAGGRVRKARPLLLEGLRAMVSTCDPETPKGARDRALLLLGFNMMARRSELAGLDLADITEHEEGILVRIRRSKTDQAAVGVEVAVPFGQHAQTCAVRAVTHWREVLEERDMTSGPFLRPVDRHGRVGTERGAAGKARDRLTGKSVSSVVRGRAFAAELEHAESYVGHSLRSGAATVAYASRVPVSVIAAHGRWSEKSPVVLGYIRAVDQWQNNPMKGIGL